MKKVARFLSVTLVLAWAGAASPDLAPTKKNMIGYLALMSSLLAAINAEDFDRALPLAQSLAASAAGSETRMSGRPQASFLRFFEAGGPEDGTKPQR